MQRAYRNSTLVTAVAIAVLGIAMVVSTLAQGGGPLALGVVLGVLFMLLGAGRAWLARPSAGRR